MRYYLDCEFNGLAGALISMALVSDGSRELYLANPEFSKASKKVDPWVAKNVLPIIETEYASPLWAPLDQWGAHLQTLFLGDRAPVIVTDWPDDIKYFCQCVITGPGQMIDVPGLTFEMHRVDAYPTTMPEAVQHNAYSDAMALRFKLNPERPHGYTWTKFALDEAEKWGLKIKDAPPMSKPRNQDHLVVYSDDGYNKLVSINVTDRRIHFSIVEPKVRGQIRLAALEFERHRRVAAGKKPRGICGLHKCTHMPTEPPCEWEVENKRWTGT